MTERQRDARDTSLIITIIFVPVKDKIKLQKIVSCRLRIMKLVQHS